MKRIHFSICLAILSLLMTSCGEEEQFSPAGVAIPVELRVVADNFVSTGGTSRAAEEGYVTKFTANDQIGIFAIKASNGFVLDKNVPYKYNGKAWVPVNASNTVHQYENYLNDVTYFAYYPYSASMDDAVSEADIVTKFTPQADQSTYANYTASDLMTGAGTLSTTGEPRTLTFQLKHQMSLLVVYPRGQHYQTSDGYDFYAPPKDITTLKLGPVAAIYQPGDCTYRAIVKPGTVDVAIKYVTTEDAKLEYTGSVTAMTGKFTEMLLTLKSPALPYTISVGDYFFADGGLLSNAVTFAEVNKKNCIGIVYYAGSGPDDTINNYTDTGISGNIHGYVMALKDAYPSDMDRKWGKRAVYFNTGQTTQFNGHTKKYAEQTHALCQAAAEIRNFRIAVPVPSMASTWYMPSYAQLVAIWNAYKHSEEGIIYRSLQNAGGDLFANNIYWTVTEMTLHDVWVLNMQTGASVSQIGKCSGHDMGWSWDAYSGIHLTRTVLTF